MSSVGPEVMASSSAHPPEKLSFSSPQRPLGSAAVIAIPAIIGLSNSLVHSSGVKLVLSAMADLLHVCAPTPEEVARSTTVTHQHAGWGNAPHPRCALSLVCAAEPACEVIPLPPRVLTSLIVVLVHLGRSAEGVPKLNRPTWADAVWDDSQRAAGGLRGLSGALSPQPSAGLSRRCMSRLVLNVGTTFSDTAISTPLRGFRPVRASRVLTANTPKSRSSTRSPRARAAVIVSKMALTIVSTSRWYRCGFSAAILSISSDLSIEASR